MVRGQTQPHVTDETEEPEMVTGPFPFKHVTVLRNEVVEALSPRQGGLYLDVTLGGGGHSEALLEAGARVVGCDRDPAARPPPPQRKP